GRCPDLGVRSRRPRRRARGDERVRTRALRLGPVPGVRRCGARPVPRRRGCGGRLPRLHWFQPRGVGLRRRRAHHPRGRRSRGRRGGSGADHPRPRRPPRPGRGRHARPARRAPLPPAAARTVTAYRWFLRLFGTLPEAVRYRIARVIKPKYTVGTIPFVFRDDGRVLLVRHSYKTGWATPGGFVNRREVAADAAVREVREEVGLAVRVVGEPA